MSGGFIGRIGEWSIITEALPQRACSCLVKEADGLGSAVGLGVALHVQGDSALDVFLGADAVDGLLHLPMAAVAPLHGVGRGRQERIVQERQRFLEGGGERLLGLVESLSRKIESIDRAGFLDASVLGETVHPRNFSHHRSATTNRQANRVA